MATVRKVAWTHNGVTKTAWQVTYTDPVTGKRPSKNFREAKTAKAYKLKVEREIDDGTHTSLSRGRTVAETAEAFIRQCEERMQDGRIGAHRFGAIKLFLTRDVVPFLGTTMVGDLTISAVEELYSKLLKCRGLQPHVLRTRFVILKQLEDFAFRRDWTKKAVVPHAMQSFRGLETPEQRRFTTEDVLLLLQQVGQRRTRSTVRSTALTGCFVGLAAFCGLRYGEIAALREEHIRFDEGIIEVRHSLTTRDVLKGPKTKAGNRDVPMPANVAAMLRAWLDQHRIPEKRGLIFRTREGTAITSGSFHRIRWRPLLDECGLGVEIGGDAYHFHALRGFAASWWIDNGVPVTTVAKWLGHSKPDMTLEFYARSMVSRAGQRELADRMASRLLSSVTTIDVPALDATRAREVTLSD